VKKGFAQRRKENKGILHTSPQKNFASFSVRKLVSRKDAKQILSPTASSNRKNPLRLRVKKRFCD